MRAVALRRNQRAHPVTSWPITVAARMACPLRSMDITSTSSLLRGSPPLVGASVLLASRGVRLYRFL
jgi:hypothetical protein